MAETFEPACVRNASIFCCNNSTLDVRALADPLATPASGLVTRLLDGATMYGPPSPVVVNPFIFIKASSDVTEVPSKLLTVAVNILAALAVSELFS